MGDVRDLRDYRYSWGYSVWVGVVGEGKEPSRCECGTSKCAGMWGTLGSGVGVEKDRR